MQLSTQDFAKQVQQEIDFRYDSYSYSQETKNLPFAQWILELIFPYIDSDEALNRLNPENNSYITATYQDDNSGNFYIVYTRYAEDSSTTTYGAGVLYGVLDIYAKILTNHKTFLHDNNILGEAARALDTGYSLSVMIALWGSFDQSVDITEIQSKYNISSDQLIIYDLNELGLLYSGFDNRANNQKIVMYSETMTEFNQPINSLIANIAGTEFKKAVEHLVPDIYDINLRRPLGKTKINKEIGLTLSDPDKSRLFWYYNNGVTMLCTGFNIDEGDKKILTIDSPRIVNGAQTTNALIHFLGNNPHVYVMIRVIAALPGSHQVEEDLKGEDIALQEISLDIARYTNSQNPIEVPDFRSNDEVQKRLAEKFDSLGWFYEHRRGQWDGCENKSQYRVNGKYNKLKMQDIAQYWFAFDGHPVISIKEKLSLFEEQGYYGNIFMLNRSGEEFLFASILFDRLQDRIKEKINLAKQEARQASETSNRASLSARNYLIISRATKLTVAHMVALVGQALKDKYTHFDRTTAVQLIPHLHDGTFIDKVYIELEDAIFRIISQIQDEKYRTFYNVVADKKTFPELYDLFKYILERESSRGRDVFEFIKKQ